MRITWISLRGFRVYEHLDLEVPPGLVGIYGPNGAGKSSLLEAIVWVLYGRARTAKGDIRTAGFGGECSVELGFEHDGHHYTVRRSISGVNATVKARVHAGSLVAADGPAVNLTRDMVLASSPQGYADACAALVAVDLSSRVASIEAPTLIMCGRDDLPAFVNAAPVLASTIRGARLSWIEGGRHAAVLECSEQSTRDLDGFLPRA